mmetsp:Transcript_12773/g.32903  ORF Transcript_12773/g.32903 Transcript_12773/m.32903 type:complete len:200 (-) Transcript_12773:27-626(-)
MMARDQKIAYAQAIDGQSYACGGKTSGQVAQRRPITTSLWKAARSAAALDACASSGVPASSSDASVAGQCRGSDAGSSSPGRAAMYGAHRLLAPCARCANSRSIRRYGSSSPGEMSLAARCRSGGPMRGSSSAAAAVRTTLHGQRNATAPAGSAVAAQTPRPPYADAPTVMGARSAPSAASQLIRASAPLLRADGQAIE